MALSCECDFDWDGDGWWYYIPDDFSKMPKARTTCCSCKAPVRISEACLIFNREEVDIWGDNVDIEPWFMCEECGEIYLNMADLGYCIALGYDNMHELLKEYHELTGFVSQG